MFPQVAVTVLPARATAGLSAMNTPVGVAVRVGVAVTVGVAVAVAVAVTVAVGVTVAVAVAVAVAVGVLVTVAVAVAVAGAVTVKVLLVARTVKPLLLSKRSSYVPGLWPAGIGNGQLP